MPLLALCTYLSEGSVAVGAFAHSGAPLSARYLKDSTTVTRYKEPREGIRHDVDIGGDVADGRQPVAPL